MSAQNRGSGAYAALTEGKAAAASALARLGRAEVSYAKRGSHLLRGQHRLARSRRRRAAPPRPAPARRPLGRRAKAVRRFLAGIASRRASAWTGAPPPPSPASAAEPSIWLSVLLGTGGLSMSAGSAESP